MRTLRCLFIMIFAAALAPPIHAQSYSEPIHIGDKLPAWEWEDDGDTKKADLPTLDELEDHIIVLYFFRTTDASLESVAPVNAAAEKFESLGVKVYGLTNEEKKDVEKITKGKGVRFDVAYGFPVHIVYQVTSFPMVYLTDTDHRLRARFHPEDDLVGRIRAQIARTPPPLADPARLQRRIARAKEAHQDDHIGTAFTLAKKVADATEDTSETGRSARSLVERIKERAEEWLDDARQLARKEQYDEAIRKLAILSVRFQGEEFVSEVDTEIARLMGRGELKPKILDAKKNVAGQILVDEAEDYALNKRYLEALDLYRQVIDEYEDTEAAKAADVAIDQIHDDPMASAAVQALRADQQADRWLEIGELFAKVEMHDKAREYLERLISAYPTARAAEKARELLAKLPEPTPEDDADTAEETAAADGPTTD